VTDPIPSLDTPATATRPSALGTGRAVILIALAGLFAYYNSLHAAFVLDDALVVGHPDIGHPFKNPIAVRPVVALSIAANYRLDGLNSRGYHLFNLLVHVAAAVALFELVRRTLRLPRFAGRYADRADWIGLSVALVWLVHPLNTQAVTYMVQRCESMMGLFFLLGLLCFLRGATADTRQRSWYCGAVVSAALGAGCKEVMIVFPAVVVLFDRAFLAGSWRGVLRRWRVHVALAVPPILGAVGFALRGVLTAPGTVGLHVTTSTPYTYALTQTEVILHYIRLAFWPSGLTLDYLDWPIRKSLGEAWPTVLALGLLLLVVAYGVGRNRAWGFLAATFFLVLAPTSSIVPLQDAAFEHRMYLSLAALVTLVGVGVAQLLALLRERFPESVLAIDRATAAGVFLLVTVLGFVTVVRNEDYGSQLQMFADNARKRPNNPRVRGTYAGFLMQTDALDEAEKEIRQAIDCPIQWPGNRGTLAQVLYMEGKLDESLAVAWRAHAEMPGDPGTNRQLGTIFVAAGRPTDALPVLGAVLDKDPADKPARLHRAIALEELGNPTDAAREFDLLRAADPAYAKQLTSIARRIAMDPKAAAVHEQMAVRYARAATRIGKPDDPDTVDTLAIALARVGRYSEAAETEKRAAELAEKAGRDAYAVSLLRAREQRFRLNRPYLPDALAKEDKR
jgi:Flp pilus assembly protein TadD